MRRVIAEEEKSFMNFNALFGMCELWHDEKNKILIDYFRLDLVNSWNGHKTLARIISWDFLTADCRFSGFLLKDNRMLNRFFYSVSRDPATNSETTETEFLYLTRYKQTTNFHKQFQDSQFQNWLLDTISNMKLCYCEKAKKFEKISHLILTNYLVTFFKFLWPSNNIWTLNVCR